MKEEGIGGGVSDEVEVVVRGKHGLLNFLSLAKHCEIRGKGVRKGGVVMRG